MKILYLGDDSPYSTSYHRAQALIRLGHEVTHIDPRARLRGYKYLPICVRFGFIVFKPIIDPYVRSKVGKESFDVAWLDTGADVSPGLHRWFKKKGMRIINYNVDDPFGGRDRRKWDLYMGSLKYHDLTVVVREENVKEAEAAGARNVMRVYRSYDPVAHAPVTPTEEEVKEWSSEVSFIGTWMPGRGTFIAELLQLGVPVVIRGNRWFKAPEWPIIKDIWKGSSAGGREYVLALQCSKITLGFLSKDNRDLHTTRSAEAPYIGGAVFCAERTAEHREMFDEGDEAVFWDDAKECAEKCMELLDDDARRLKIAAAGKDKIEKLQLSNDHVIQEILARLG